MRGTMGFSSCFSVLLIGFLAASLAAIEKDFYSFSAEDIYGDTVDLDRYRGTVSLVVNVASECGFTDSHYKELSAIQEYLGKNEKFQVMVFPCNQFGEQEPGDNFHIFEKITTKYYVNYLMFGKVDVLGEKADPAFHNLIEQSGKAPDWNFWKYLVDADGKVLNAWGPKTSVADVYEEVRTAVAAIGGLEDDVQRPDDEL